MNRHFGIKTILIIGCFLSAAAAYAADTVSGKVLNQTTQRPAAGDDVVLLRMGEGMQEEARVRTDAQGAFSMNLAHPGAQYVLRVLHQGVNYDHTLTGASTVRLEVFDVAPAIKGLKGALGIAQIESDGTTLKVTEMYSIANVSTPPVTQTSPHNFQISLPAEAMLDSFTAKRAQGVWVNLAPVPVLGKQGIFAVDFPLRPGDTLFKFSYHLPGSGATTLRLKPAYPVQSFAVMHPPSMAFKSLRPHAFTSPGVVKGLQVEQAVGGVARDVPAFEISGIGVTAPRPALAKAVPPSVVLGAATGSSSTPSANPQSEIDQHNADQRKKDVWAVGLLTLFLIAGGGFALWRRQKRIGARNSGGQNMPVVQALKDELFQLETERSRGKMSEEQYSSTRDALNLSLQRAMTREKA
jgi:cbb3-type cytochrome oxidase subunit 3